MTDERFRLIAAILSDLCQERMKRLITPHPSFAVNGGAPPGRCSCCGALGRLHADGYAEYRHTDACIFSLYARLQQMQELEGKSV